MAMKTYRPDRRINIVLANQIYTELKNSEDEPYANIPEVLDDTTNVIGGLIQQGVDPAEI